MNVTKEQIDNWIKDFETGDNKKYIDRVGDSRYSDRLSIRLVEGKVLVDRWNLFSNIIIFNNENKQRILEILCDKLISVKYSEGDMEPSYSLWGSAVYFSDDIERNKCMLIATDESGNLAAESGRAVAIVPLDGLKL